jgi:hypothetical protein
MTSKAIYTFGDQNQYTFYAASTRNEREEAFSLVHDEYCKKGYIKPLKSGLWYTAHHALVNTIVLCIRNDSGQLIASSSMCTDSILGLPCDRLYPHEVSLIRKKTPHVSEVFSLAIRNNSIGLKNRLTVLSYMLQASFWTLGDFLKQEEELLIVSPEHAKFYERTYDLEIFGTEKPDHDFSLPAVGIRINVAKMFRLNQMGRLAEDCKINDRSMWIRAIDPKLFHSFLGNSVQPPSKSDVDHFFLNNEEFRVRTSPEKLRSLENYINECNIL